MSQEYKDRIDRLVQDANKGNTKATKELLEETEKWNKIIDDLKKNKKG